MTDANPGQVVTTRSASRDPTRATTLRLNGFDLRATADDAEPLVVEEVIRARVPLARIATWIEQHIEDRGSSDE